MANKVGYIFGADQQASDEPIRLIDNLDGTFSISVGGTITTTISAADLAPILAILGATNGAAVVTDANGTIQQYLRGLVTLIASSSITQTFSVTDTIKRPNNATPYAANQAINSDLTVTEVSYSGLVVTVKAAGHGLFTGTDTTHNRVTIAGIDGQGAPVVFAHINGNWIATPIDADHFSFTVAIQPTGTTPQTGLTIAHAVSKMMSFDVGGVAGAGVLITSLKASLPGKAMTGAVRLYLDDTQVTVLVDATTYPLQIANQAYRKLYYDLNPITENASSDCTVAETNKDYVPTVVKCAAGDTHIYMRAVAEAAGTPTALGLLLVTMTGIKLLG
jgi:hypothetical protein